MRSRGWDRPEEFDHVLVVADDDPVHLRSLGERLTRAPGRDRVSVVGRYPRFKVVPASNGEEALSAVTPEVTVVAVDILMPHRDGIEVIQELRRRRPDLAILAFTGTAPASEALAAIMAGADHFHEYRDLDAIEHAVDLAIDRRRLTRLLEQNEAAVAEARERLARLQGGLGVLVGLRPPQSKETVLPFAEAVRRYLKAAAKLYEGDAQGLAGKLGLSYFAMRRLLKRYGVPYPGRQRLRPPRNPRP